MHSVLSEYTTLRFFDGVHLHGPTRIRTSRGVVTAIESFDGTPEHYLLSPGFLDIQMNGFGAHRVAGASVDELRALGEELSRLGTTSWLGTIVTAPLEKLTVCLDSLHDAISGGIVPGLLGIHIEGPFLGEAPGAHNPQWIIPFDQKWLSLLPKSVRLITVAAEQDNAPEFISSLVERGVCIALGHSQPTAIQFQSCIDAGATMVTHLFNGMSGVHHRQEGLALMALTTDHVAAGLIADLVHVSPSAIRLAFAAKGSRLICLVSDSVDWLSSSAQKRGVEVRDGAPRLTNGILAGSCTPLAQCVANVVHVCGVPLEDALRAATSTPADVIKLSGAGRIVVGQSCDLIALNAELLVVDTWRALPSVRA